MGLVFQFAYSLERHRLFNVSLRRWLILLCLVLPLTMWLRLWGVSYLVAGFVTMGAVTVLVVMWWADRQRYVQFMTCAPDAVSAFPQADEEEVDGAANRQLLPAMDKIHVRATGFFEVSGMRRYFVETPANYTTFETREHCVMTHISLARFLLFGVSSQDEVGWWYAFFQPAMIRSVDVGWLHFGLRPRAALRLQITLSDDSKDEILYLSFDDEATSSLVVADLLYDAGIGYRVK